ncbi:SRPBCC family protein [Aliiruegeria sabulilitoris]|uniref:SRPBCC family protein n=1 Tax=Aliiruegeria sabulilitoris TaxID=1510458 RepID=UPI00082E0164|nr:SRPBCC domain-containing protein [Aliiruegeria sabulilitoris]NDR59566.1 SRPBCC domain-containing protein [Pseudoruegeria sp. M32A2M]
MSGLSIRKTIYLDATPERVWSFLTEPERLAKWFHPSQAPLSEGEDYVLTDVGSGQELIRGRVLSAQPPHGLHLTFEIPPLQGRDTEIRWTLEVLPGGTRLSLEHDGLPDGEGAFGLILALDEGWDAHLGALRLNVPDVEPEKTN